MFLSLVGVALLVVAGAADALGLGSRSGLGRSQVLLGLLGIVCFGGALALRTGRGDRLLFYLADRSPTRIRFREVLALVVFFALIGGLADSGLLYLQNALGHGFDFIPPGHVGMSSVSFLVILSIPALGAWLLGRVVLDFFGSERLIVAVLTLLVVLGVFFSYYPELAVWAILILSVGVAVQAWHHATDHSGWFVRVSNRFAGLLAVLVIVLAAVSTLVPRVEESLATSRLPDPTPEARNVLLIILDTVRARNMSLYGYARATTPYLESLAESSVVFNRAYATSSWTLPTHASIFTGLQPHDLSADWITPLDDEHRTLAELLSSRGYRTAGFVGNQAYAGPQTGLDRGFQHYDASYLRPRTVLGASALGRLVLLGRRPTWSWSRLQRKPGSTITEQFLEWLPDSSGRPFFAFLNFYDAHAPYEPPDPFDNYFVADAPLVRPVHGHVARCLALGCRAVGDASGSFPRFGSLRAELELIVRQRWPGHGAGRANRFPLSGRRGRLSGIRDHELTALCGRSERGGRSLRPGSRLVGTGEPGRVARVPR